MKTYYVDTARTTLNKRRQKTHVVFDSERIFKVEKLTDLKDAGEVFIDTLFPENYDEALELLKNNVKIYLLKDAVILKRLRLENGVKKSDENDAVMLSKIPRDNYRLLTIDEIELKITMRPLINRYEMLTKRRKILKQWLDDCDIPEVAEALRENIKLLEKMSKEVSREIIDKVSNDRLYIEACRLLGLQDSVEVAILTIELPLHYPSKTLKKIVGLTPNKNNGRYNHCLREHLSRLAFNIYLNIKRWKDRWMVPEEFSKIVEELPPRKAVYKLQSRILKTFRKAYFTVIEADDTPAGR